VACTPETSLLPAALPGPESAQRWPWLQRLRRSSDVPLEAWLQAIETGALSLDADLIAALAPRLDAAAALRLLDGWLRGGSRDPAVLQVIGQHRGPALAARLRQALAADGVGRAPWLLPLLGHQRDPADFALLSSWLLGPQPLRCRQAALEGLAVGLSSWPLPALRALLRQLVTGLQPSLAAPALDLLARLPQPRRALAGLAPAALEPSVQRRRQRRLAALPANPLVLVVHGRSGGLIPPELEVLRAELQSLRRSPVLLQALTAAALPVPEPLRQAAEGQPLSLMPLLLLPGSHVCGDVPALAARWRSSGPVIRLPFLGAWPLWQQALRQEVCALVAASEPSAGDDGPLLPLLLHHPLRSSLAGRYLAHLGPFCGATCLPTPYSAPDSDAGRSLLEDPSDRPVVLPLVLASNRLTEALPDWCAEPLLQRPALRACLLDLLLCLP